MAKITKEEETNSPSWGASFFMQTTEDVAKAVAAAMNTPRPSVIYSSKNEQGGSQLQRLQHQVTKMIKGFSRPPEVKYANYNPEILTSQKRQWAANFHLQYNDHRAWKEPTKLFESMVVVGLHPNCDIQALQRQYFVRKSEGSGKLRSALGYQNQSRVEPNVEPQVLFVYPPEKQLPLKEKDLLSFCFPGGLEVKAVERTPSMSELNEILFGQEHLKQRDLSFVFRLQGADNSTLYGCCVLVEELVHKPSGLLSMISDKQPSNSTLRRHILTTQRCYCILSRLPFFELHFGVLNSIFMQERLERLTKSVEYLDLEFAENSYEEENSEGNSECVLVNDRLAEDKLDENPRTSESNLINSLPENIEGDGIHPNKQMINEELHTLKEEADDDKIVPIHPESDVKIAKEESGLTIAEDNNTYSDALVVNKQSEDRRLPNAVLPLLRYYQYESSESSCSFQGSPCEDRSFRSDADDTETEASFSGQEDLNDLHEILEWAKANNCGPLQIISEYYRFRCPTRGSTLIFHPLEHLHPLEYHRLDESDLYLSGSTIDLKSCSTGLELAEAQNSLLVAEEATALSIWAVACLCGTLRLEHVLTFFVGALLEKQIVVVCSNLGILSASVLSVIPLIRPYQWQSLLMPVLPNDMLDFLDAPVPYIVGVRNKTNEVQSKLTNVILVDANRNQVKSPSLPQLPRQKELMSSLRPYHSTLVGESYLGRRRPVYECTEVQVEAAKGFLSVLRSYLDSLCCNIRSHTITNVQSNDDKVSLLLRESFIDSFPYRDRPFMKLFVDTQLFSVHTDIILSYFQKE